MIENDNLDSESRNDPLSLPSLAMIPVGLVAAIAMLLLRWCAIPTMPTWLIAMPAVYALLGVVTVVVILWLDEE